jgi:hypothetical protein
MDSSLFLWRPEQSILSWVALQVPRIGEGTHSFKPLHWPLASGYPESVHDPEGGDFRRGLRAVSWHNREARRVHPSALEKGPQ